MLLKPFSRSQKPKSKSRRNLLARRRSMLLESLEDRRLLHGDTLSAATFIGLSHSKVETSAFMGDGTFGGKDVDLWRFHLNAGERLVADIDARHLDGGGSISNLDSILRIFNASGAQVAVNDDASDPDTGVFSYDAAINSYLAPSSGTYYVGVSGYSNFSYNPTVGGSGTNGDTGSYRLQLTVRDNDTSGPSISFSNAVNQSDGANNIVGWSISDASGIFSRSVTLRQGGSSGPVIFSNTSSNSGSFNLNSLAPGTYTILASATDDDSDRGAADRSSSSLARTFTISDDDTSGPSISFSNAVNQSDGDNNIVGWSITDASGIASRSVQLRRLSDNAVLFNNTSNNSGSFNLNSLPPGGYRIEATATDADSDRSGDSLTSSTSSTFSIFDDDTAGPTIILGGSTGSESHGLTQAFTWIASDPSGIAGTSVAITRNGSSIYTSSAPSGSFNFDSFGLGTYVINVASTDADNDRPGDALSSTASRTVIVTNADPVANAGADEIVEEGASMAFDGTGSTDVDGDSLTYVWNFGDGNTGSGATPSHVYADNGTYTVTLTIEDGFGGTDSDTMTVTVNNVAPTLSGLALSDTDIDEGESTTLSGTIADAGTADTFTVDIDWDGDGTVDETHTAVTAGAFSYAHTYIDDNPTGTPSDTYSVGITVTDGDGGATNSGISLSSLLSSYQPATSFSDALGGTTMTLAFDGTYYWASSGGSTSGTRYAQYDDSGNLLATYAPGLDFRSVFTDDAGTVYARAFSSPTIYTQSSPGVFVDSGIALSGGNLGSQSSVVLNGDESEFVAFGNGLLSRWNRNGSYLGSVSFSGWGSIPGENDYPDNRGIAVVNGYYLTYSNENLSVWDQAGNRVGQTQLISGGSSFDSNFSVSYANDQVFVVTTRGGTWNGFDLDGAGVNLTVVVDNVAPIAEAGADQAMTEGDLVTLSGSFTDQGTDDGHKQEWSVVASNGQSIPGQVIDNLAGDSNGSGGTSFSFTPNDNGIYTVSYTVTDDDGGTHTDTAVITVDNVAPQNVSAGADQTVDEADTVNLSGSFTDPGSADTHTLLWQVSASNGQTIADGAGANFSFVPNDNGTYTVTFTVTDDDGGVTSDEAIVTVLNVAPAVTPVPVTQDVQYSDSIDVVTFTATDVPADVMNAAVSYSVDGSPFAAGLPDAASISGGVAFAGDADQVATGTWTISGVADLAPGTYVFRVAVSDEDGGTGTADTTVVVEQENADATYDGPLFVSTDPQNPDDGVVPLRVVVRDITAFDPSADAEAGHITTATVTFIDRTTSPHTVIASGVPVSLLGSDSKVGVATYDWSVSLQNNQSADTFEVGVVVDGYYTAEADDVLITVARPDGDFITGGGYIVNQDSAGAYAGGDGLKTNFGFNVKFNKKFTNLMGHFNGIIRRDDGAILKIKSNATQSLVVDPTVGVDGHATFVSKANLTDVTDPLNPIGIGGNLQLIVNVTDNGEPGRDVDTISFALWDGTTLLFSSNFDGTKTVEQVIAGGDTQVHTDAKPLTSAASAGGFATNLLTPEALQPAVAEAIDFWAAAGASDAQLELLHSTYVGVIDLSGALLGLASERLGAVWIDVDAAGHGWDMDPSTSERMELASTVAHEFGHVLGLGDSSYQDDVMGSHLAPGVERMPTRLSLQPLNGGPLPSTSPLVSDAIFARSAMLDQEPVETELKGQGRKGMSIAALEKPLAMAPLELAIHSLTEMERDEEEQTSDIDAAFADLGVEWAAMR